MPVVRFLVTRDGKTALSLPPLDVSPEHTSLQGLRKAFFERTGRRAFVLHGGGLELGLDRDSYVVRMEGATPVASDEYPPLEHARAWQRPGWFRETLAWLERALGEPLLRVEQVSSYDLAAVLRVQTSARSFEKDRAR